MQADEFEKKIQNKMEGFELVPDNEVWKQVSGRIEKEKKKRRVLLYFFFAGFAFLAVTSAYWFINNENNRKLVINEPIPGTSKQENYKIKQNKNNYTQGLNEMQKAQTTKSIAYLKRDELKYVFKSEIKNKAFKKIPFAEVINNDVKVNSKKDNRKVYDQPKKQTRETLLPHKFYNPQLAAAAKADTAVKNNRVEEKTNFTKDPSSNTITKKTSLAKRQISNKWHLGFTVYSGISDNLSGLPLLEKSYADYSSPITTSAQSYNSGIINNYSINALNNFKSAFSFGLGIFAKKQLTQRISLSGGADFRFYSAKSLTGTKVNQQRSFYDSSDQKATSVNGYYTIGNSVKYSNKYQLLELPVNLMLQLNKSQKRPLLIFAGISPGYMLSSNALYANTSANVYYTDKEKLHHFQLSAQTGLSFPFKNSNSYTLSAGPAVQYGFTNVTKVAGGDQHLLFAGLKANIIFK